jgi:hypothetical protein
MLIEPYVPVLAGQLQGCLAVARAAQEKTA